MKNIFGNDLNYLEPEKVINGVNILLANNRKQSNRHCRCSSWIIIFINEAMFKIKSQPNEYVLL